MLPLSLRPASPLLSSPALLVMPVCCNRSLTDVRRLLQGFRRGVQLRDLLRFVPSVSVDESISLDHVIQVEHRLHVYRGFACQHS